VDARIWLLLLALATAGCTSDPVDAGAMGAGGEGGAADAGGASGRGGARSEPEECPEGPYPRSQTESVDVGSVQATFVDDRGQPTSAGLVQVCGKDVCVNANVPESGRMSQAVNQAIEAPACKYGDGREFGKLVIPLPPGERDADLGSITAVRLPSFEDGVPLVPGGRVSSGGVTLELSEDANVHVDRLTYEEDSEHGFRAAELTPEALDDLGQGFALAFTLAPVETRICPNPSLSLDNGAELEPGAELELFVLGLDVTEEWAPYSLWEKVGEGSASDDGQRLEFPGGIPILTAIGIKVKP
jgi:hypothetical protein